jgi:hypothetical protein
MASGWLRSKTIGHAVAVKARYQAAHAMVACAIFATSNSLKSYRVRKLRNIHAITWKLRMHPSRQADIQTAGERA